MLNPLAQTIETEDAILGFFGKYRFLSNYHLCDIKCEDGFIYPSSENAFMAYKTMDMDVRLLFTECTPKEAKAMGQKVKLRDGWDNIRLNVMESILRLKFNLPGLKNLLLATENKYLVESNYWNDTYWGQCNGVGENNLGKLLMKIRSEK